MDKSFPRVTMHYRMGSIHLIGSSVGVKQTNLDTIAMYTMGVMG